MAFITTDIEIRGEKRPYFWQVSGYQLDKIAYGKVAIVELACFISPQQAKSDDNCRNNIWTEKQSFPSENLSILAVEVDSVMELACLRLERFKNAIVDTIGENWTEENWKDFVNTGNLPIFNP